MIQVHQCQYINLEIAYKIIFSDEAKTYLEGLLEELKVKNITGNKISSNIKVRKMIIT